MVCSLLYLELLHFPTCDHAHYLQSLCSTGYMLEQNANVLLSSVRKRKLELNVIINCEPQWRPYGEGMAAHKEPQCIMG